jgi:hypothetical protein
MKTFMKDQQAFSHRAMPSSESPTATIQPDPNIPVGLCKRYPTKCVTENADPLPCKRARRTAIKDTDEPVPAPCPQPCNSTQVLEAADVNNNDESSNTKVVIELPDTDEDIERASEDDDAELGKGYIIL